MSEKPRRDITLGEMQDECREMTDCRECKYSNVCWCNGKIIAPATLNLTDPPRFSDEAMAVFKAFKAVGVTHVQRLTWTTFYKRDMDAMPLEKFVSAGAVFANFDVFSGLEASKFYDLAELLEKDK